MIQTRKLSHISMKYWQRGHMWPYKLVGTAIRYSQEPGNSPHYLEGCVSALGCKIRGLEGTETNLPIQPWGEGRMH
jgi:hypothetical protein